jgi:hypothetical protein
MSSFIGSCPRLTPKSRRPIPDNPADSPGEGWEKFENAEFEAAHRCCALEICKLENGRKADRIGALFKSIDFVWLQRIPIDPGPSSVRVLLTPSGGWDRDLGRVQGGRE